MEIKFFDFEIIEDDRGKLVALEENKDIPFTVKRIYYIYDVANDCKRGFHAHKNLEQILVCINGSCELVIDNGTQRSSITLDRKNRGVYISALTWREMKNFSNDAVLMVFASEHYDESDYIRDYDQFKNISRLPNDLHYFKHEKALVETKKVGKNTRIWAFAHILRGAEIGEYCNICDHTFIENDVKIGNKVTIKCGVHIWDGVTIEDNVLIGPCVAFTNDKHPRSKQYKEFEKTLLNKGCSIGANATIICGNEIGEYATVGAGAVITKSVKPYSIVFGNPAVQNGFNCKCGTRLNINKEECACDECGCEYIYDPKTETLKGR